MDRIVRLNKRLIQQYGGFYVEPDNFLNRGSLEWALDAIQHKTFGYDPYPSLAHKAAVIAWTIIAGHVFKDGNKRTGMLTTYLFVRANGHEMRVTVDQTVQIALEIADHSASGMTREALTDWFAQHIRPSE